jgi:hypothetical protein
MKKPSRCCIALMIVLGMLAFFEIRDTVVGNKIFFLVRMMFRNPGYAKKIEIKTYLLTDEQVLESLQHPELEIQQPTQKELFLKNVNIVLRIKNHGHAPAWGTLAYTFNNVYWSKIDIRLDHTTGKENHPFCEYVIPMGIQIPFDNDELPRPIQVKWISLYAKY